LSARGTDQRAESGGMNTGLIVFDLLPRQDGIELTICESGFDRIPTARRANAYAANDSGWAHQARLIEKYLARQA
jgi:hypothetical protein